MRKEILITAGEVKLEGHVITNNQCCGWVIFAHGSGSSRGSQRNNWVAQKLCEAGYSTLLFDLLTYQEDLVYRNRFEISLLAERLLAATQWLVSSPYYNHEPFFYFGASTGAAAALTAAAQIPPSWNLKGVVSRGGRPDLTLQDYFTYVSVPVLLIVGSLDTEVIKFNQTAAKFLKQVELKIVPGATHLFEEQGKLYEVEQIVEEWLGKILRESEGSRAMI